MTMHIRQPLAHPKIDSLVGLQTATPRGHGLYRRFVKRVMDIALVLIVALPALLLLLPFAAMIAGDGASPIYRQRRVGRNGRVFHMWKLRSMVPNADQMLDAHLANDPQAAAEWRSQQKLRQDPRITPIGQLIRKSSIDELPQLWNVLRGDMSLVGPRPMMVDQQDIYPGSAYYAMRPGITGFWQTSVRNESSFVERAAYDTDYLRKLSLRTDISILLRTVRVVLTGTGC
ncbi:sugar transferase [Roseivivax sp. CAU 1753]